MYPVGIRSLPAGCPEHPLASSSIQGLPTQGSKIPTDFLSATLVLWVPEFYMNEIIQSVLFCVSFAQHSTLQTESRCVLQGFMFSFVKQSSSVECVTVYLSPVGGWICPFISLGKRLKSKIAEPCKGVRNHCGCGLGTSWDARMSHHSPGL